MKQKYSTARPWRPRHHRYKSSVPLMEPLPIQEQLAESEQRDDDYAYIDKHNLEQLELDLADTDRPDP